jgi:hypothetical protein
MRDVGQIGPRFTLPAKVRVAHEQQALQEYLQDT